MRTALLDMINAGAPLQKVPDRRPGKQRNENNLELQQRLFKYRAGKFELDPLRLIQLSDARWTGGAELPTAQVYLAANRKKAPVRDEQGSLRTSKAESGPDQILECIPPLFYRSFIAELNVQSVHGVTASVKLPDAGLRFDMDRVAKACNGFYCSILKAELSLLRNRGYVDETWAKSMDGILEDPRLDAGTAFLLRVGRHSGAESVTLRGVRSIRIMKAAGQPPEHAHESKTVWLAAKEKGQQSELLPFGWVLVEVAPMDQSGLQHYDTLKAICDAQLGPARDWGRAIAAKKRTLDEAKAIAEARRREGQEAARRKVAAEAEAAQLENERQARVAAMSREERLVEDLRKLYENEAQRGVLKPGSATVGKLNELLKVAVDWPAPACRLLADLAEQIFGHSAVGWGSGDKRRERREKIAALRQKP